MADDQKQLGLLKEYSVYLLNADGTRSVGITRLIRQMSITEDIFKNTLYGSVRIKDAVDLLGGHLGKNNVNIVGNSKGFPILGEEFLEVQYTSAFNDQTVKLRFAVYSIEDIIYKNNNTVKEYTLNFCSEEHLIDAITVVMKKYSKQNSDNVKDLCRDFLNLDDGTGTVTDSQSAVATLGYPATGDKARFKGKKKLLTVQPTAGVQNVVIPRLSPLQAAEFFARRSMGDDEKFQSGTFLFFENFEGFHFCDLEYLILKGVQKASQGAKPYTYFYENPLIKDPKEQPDPEREYKTILRIDHVHYFDTIEKLKIGMFESDVITYDFINAAHTPSRYRFLNNENMNNRDGIALGNFDNKNYPENSTSFMKKVVSKDDTEMRYTRKFFIPKDLSEPDKDTYLDIIYPNRASYFTRLAQDVFTVHTYGDPTIKAGDVILLNVPQGDGSNPGAKNEFLSGFFLVGTIKHVFTQTTYVTIMDIYKNAFGAPVQTTDESVTNKPDPAVNDGPKVTPPPNDPSTTPPADKTAPKAPPPEKSVLP